MSLDEHNSLTASHGPVTTTPEQRRRARRFVASRALDANDCRELLEALGLDGDETRSDAYDTA